MPALPPGAPEPAAILVVDDREDKMLALQSMLEGLGELVCARSGGEALRHLLQRDFAVILLDVNMPVMDGFETATLARGRERSQGTPIIFLTADEGEAGLIRGYTLGAVDFIRVPVVREVLRAKVAVFVELFRARRQLERQAAEMLSLNRRLANGVDELTAVNQELEAFSYSVSHDLRAPVRHISGFVDLLRERAGPALDEKSGRYLDTISQAAARMGQLIDDLLEFSRMARAEMLQRRVELTPLVAEVARQLAEQEPGRQVEWVIAPLPAVTGDAALLRLVLENLMGNALKYTRPRPEARIEVGGRPAGGQLELWVRDNGVGFDMQYADRLFGVFQRLHRAEEFEGTGIGLATVQRIVRRHGGRVWTQAEVDAGATFFFTLPLAAASEA
jgi:two-component system sensor histidine kinase/response regulator